MGSILPGGLADLLTGHMPGRGNISGGSGLGVIKGSSGSGSGSGIVSGGGGGGGGGGNRDNSKGRGDVGFCGGAAAQMLKVRTSRGGARMRVSYDTHLPILYLWDGEDSQTLLAGMVIPTLHGRVI